MTIVPFILAGGRGHRLWPASRPGRAKQFLPLVADESLIQATYRRIVPLAAGGPVYVVTVEEDVPLVAEALPELPAENIWAEPEGRNTGPSIAWALHEASPDHGEAVAAFFPADHIFDDDADLLSLVRRAAVAVAMTPRIALLGVRPSREETGYGYIEAGEAPVAGDELRGIRAFLEKPDAATAADLARRDDVFWNSGIFIMPVAAGLPVIRGASPALAGFLDRLPSPGTARHAGDPERTTLAAAFAGSGPVSFDVAVLEKTTQRGMLALESGWNDLGSWQAVWEARPKDAAGNAVSGRAIVLDSKGCLVEGNGRTVAALGIEDLVVVALEDTVLVCPRERAQDIRRLVEAVAGGSVAAGKSS